MSGKYNKNKNTQIWNVKHDLGKYLDVNIK